MLFITFILSSSIRCGSFHISVINPIPITSLNISSVTEHSSLQLVINVGSAASHMFTECPYNVIAGDNSSKA